MNTNTLTNTENSIALARQATAALITNAGKAWTLAEQQTIKAGRLLVESANLARDCGLQLMEAAGHEQISFEWFHSHKDALPKSMTFGAMKKCVHIARNFEKPVQDMNEVRQVQQSLFEAFGVTEPPQRDTPQVAHEKNWFSDWVSATASLDSLFRRAEKPMNEWRRDELTKFVAAVEPIAQKYEEAKGLLK